MNTQNQQSKVEQTTKPDLVAKIREGYGKNTRFERIGVAWTKEDGSVYFKPHGKQIIEGLVFLFKIDTEE